MADGLQHGVVVEFNSSSVVLLCDLGKSFPLSDSYPKPNSML